MGGSWNINIQEKTYSYPETMKTREERNDVGEAAKRELVGDHKGGALEEERGELGFIHLGDADIRTFKEERKRLREAAKRELERDV